MNTPVLDSPAAVSALPPAEEAAVATRWAQFAEQAPSVWNTPDAAVVAEAALGQSPCSARVMTAALLYLSVLPPRADWSQSMANAYSERLRPLGLTLLSGALSALRNRPSSLWRPTPDEIVAAAARFASPTPSADAVYVEVCHRRKTHAENACWRLMEPRDPRSIVWETRRPALSEWSHPLLDEVVERLGGWMKVLGGFAWDKGGDQEVVRAAYERAQVEWYGRVMEQLARPARQRDAVWFPSEAPPVVYSSIDALAQRAAARIGSRS